MTKKGSKTAFDFKLLFEQLPGLYLVCDSTLLVVSVSQKYLARAGVESEQILGRPLQEIFQWGDLSALLKKIGETRISETALLNRVWRVTLSPVLHKKKLHGLIVRVEDATEQSASSLWLAKRADQMEAEISQKTVDLQESNSAIREILDGITDAFISVNNEWIITYLNDEAVSLIGNSGTKSSLRGKDFWTVVPESIGIKYKHRYLEARRKDLPIHFEELNGELGKWYQIHLRPSQNGMSIYFQDISTVKRLEEELERFFSVSLDLLCMSGMDGYFKRLNPAWQRVLGFTPEELCSKPILEFVHPDDVARTIAEIDHQKQGTTVLSFENRFLCKDGTYRWLSWKSVPVGDLMYAAARDVTQSKLYEEERERSIQEFKKLNEELESRVLERTHDVQATTALFRQVTETIDEVFWMTDIENGQILYISPSYEKIWGRKIEELYRTPEVLLDSIHPEDQFRVRTAARLRIEGKYLEEYRIIRPDGTIRWIRDRAYPVLNKSGKPYRVVGTAVDITESHLSAERLRQIERERGELQIKEQSALQTSRLKSEFLANMSHEIRTPINGVIGMSGLLLQTQLNDEQRDYVENVHRSADMLLTVINDILDFSKVEAGKLDLESVEFDLEQLIRDTEKALVLEAQKKKVPVVVEFKTQFPKCMIGDPGRIRQIIANLLNNAIKFTERGRITLRVSEEYDFGPTRCIRFEVQDTGLGIPQSVVGRLFQAFTQADSSTTRRFGGTGLGLSICKRLVELMGGAIDVKSEVGLGSTFWFILPLKTGFLPTAELKKTQEPRKAAPRREKILVAEDNAINQKIALKQLQNLGFTADVVSNGREALEAIKSHKYDLILMDCQMPELDGFQCTQAIRTGHKDSNPHIPIVAMTANAMAGDREKCLAAGMNDYVSKPIKVEDLGKMLDKWLLR